MPRTRNFSVLLLLLALAAHAAAQTQTPAPARTPTPTPREGKPASKRPTRAEADPLAAQRRAQAVVLLTSLANDAAGFRDETLRARAQARAADALWETDAELARTLFRRAWEAADSADREAQRKMDEDIKAQLARGGGAVSSTPPNLRGEVLRLAARRDRALGEEFLARLAKAAEREADDAKPAANEAGNSPDAGQRLGLAQQLLEEGDAERALQFAEPGLVSATLQSVGFLSALREKDAATADRLYAALLARAEADPASDANTVSLLSSYAFTPFSFFNVYRGGGTGTSVMRSGIPAPDLAPALRASFFRTAARILLRPQTTEEYERTPAGRTGTYVIIRRLLPLFERHAPDLTAALNARAAALLPDVPGRMRGAEAERDFAIGPRPDDAAPRDEIQAALDRAARTPGVAERDAIYASAAISASWKGDPRAPEILGKIVDLDLARRVREFADFAFVRFSVEKKDAEAAVARASKGELTHVQRAWAYERAAELLYKADRNRAVSLLEDAAEEARRIDNTDADRPRALVGIATRYAKIDPARAWEFIYEAARAAGAAEAFTGEDAKLVVQFRAGRSAWITDMGVEEFDLKDVLVALAEDDWDRAVQLAGSFKGEAARVTATVTLARTALTGKRR